MSAPNLDPLINDLLCGQEAARYRASSLEQMLRSARRRRRRRELRRVTLLAALPVVLIFTFLIARAPAPAPERVSHAPLPPASKITASGADESTQSRTARIHFISDDELLSLFPGRPVALIGAPGQQQLVFLGSAGLLQDEKSSPP